MENHNNKAAAIEKLLADRLPSCTVTRSHDFDNMKTRFRVQENRKRPLFSISDDFLADRSEAEILEILGEIDWVAWYRCLDPVTQQEWIYSSHGKFQPRT